MSNEQREGRLLRGVGGLYTAQDDADGAEYVLRARGRFRREGMTPLVGDRVLFTPGDGEEHGWIDEILPRTSISLRPPVANVSLMVIVIAPEPAPDLLLVDRLLVRAGQSNYKPLLCVNKVDLDPQLPQRLEQAYGAAGVEVIGASALAGDGLDALKARMRGELSCMAGQSAVGKSTLLNAIFGFTLKTGEVSERIRRGRHTTRHAELLESGGIAVLDTPGFSLLTLEEGMEPEHLQDWYPEYVARSADCRFAPCVHDREPDCAVRASVAAGELDEARYERYRVLLDEVRETWKNRYK